ncbi:FeoA family protein [Tautonia sociabilis]|nr:FeoA domain-containing protein [Tautonia sociabilis]
MSVIAAMPSTEAELIPLTLLRPGQVARVDQVLGGGALVHRLREMGLRRGAEVEMIRPGSPCILRLDGHKLGVRSDELSGVLVRSGVPVA